MPLKLSGFAKRYSAYNWFRNPSRDDGPGPVSMWIGHRAKYGASSLRAEEHRFSKDALRIDIMLPAVLGGSMRKLTVLGLLVCASSAFAQETPQTLLDRALRLGDKYSWADSRDLFFKAEDGFRSYDQRNALYAKIGRLRSTMEEQSLPALSAELDALLTDPLVANDPQLRLFCLIVKGDVDGELDATSAKRDWMAVRDLADKMGNTRWKNRAGGELGFEAFLEGDVASARQLVAGALLGAVASGDKPAQARFMGAIGTGLALSGIYDEALTYLDRALSVARSDPEMGYQYVILDGKVSALKGVGKTQEALSLAEELTARARADNKNVKLCQTLIRVARLVRDQKDNQRALTLLYEAVSLAERGGFPRLLASAQFLLAETYRIMGDLDKAEAMVAQAADATRNSGDIYLIPDRLHVLALVKMDRGKYDEAEQLFSEASDYVDSMLASSPNPRARAGLLASSVSSIYPDHAGLLLGHFKDPARAYAVVERARGRTLTDLLRSGHTGFGGEDPNLEKEFSTLRLKIASSHSAVEIRKTRNDLFIRELGRWLPQGVAEPLTKPSGPDGPVPVDRIRDSLAKDQLVIEYVLGEPHSYALVLSKDGISFIELSSGQAINSLASQYLDSIKKKQAAPALGKRLYSELLGKIPGLRTARRLTIVPDGRLHLLPFDTLVNPEGQYVLMTHAINVAPSVSAFYVLSAGSERRVVARNFLGVGGVPYNQDALKVATTRGYEATGLGNLPGSEEEVTTAAALTGSNGRSTLLVGAKATEAAFKKADLRNRSIIHLAVHGVANNVQPDAAALIMLSDPGANEDGLLQSSEIVQLSLNARVVVLSACDTAVGRLQGQDGVATLSRAFLLAGAKGVVSTLWSVDDTVSAFLMKRFYQGLASGKDTAAALTEAKRSVVRTFGTRALPYHWGAFVLEGASKPI
jgi:CHAT domain-containing protein/tetratricopeptide (TPR) repeat protein